MCANLIVTGVSKKYVSGGRTHPRARKYWHVYGYDIRQGKMKAFRIPAYQVPLYKAKIKKVKVAVCKDCGCKVKYVGKLGDLSCPACSPIN